MLNQHENLVVPKSDHLRIGDCVVDIARREVQAPGTDAPRRITVKALQVLLVLVAHRGSVVSREALLEWVWSGTLPGDDVLTQAVTQLRKAFGDERDAPRYLETIAKGGYRLLADVAWLPMQRAGEVPMTMPPDAPATPADPVVEAQAPLVAEPEPRRVSPALPQRSGTKALLLAAIACVVVLVVFAGFAWRGSRQPDPAPAGRATPAIAQRSAEALPFALVAAQPIPEIQPSLSPDGNLVAYAMQGNGKGEGNAIHVQAAEAVPPTKLTEPPAGVSDIAPRWSPNGREIAFMRNGESSCDMLVIPVSGGVPRTVGRCPSLPMAQYDWLPDGSGFIAGNAGEKQQGARVSRLDLRTGLWSPLRYEAAAGDVDFDPRVSPDGRWIVFRRNISNSDFWRMPMAGGKPERLTSLRTNIHGWDWMPDGKGLVFSRLGEQLHLASLDLASREVRPLGIQDAMWVDVAARAPALTFTVVSGQTGIYRRPNPARDPAGRAERLFASSGSDLLPAISPDGRRIAFYSDRTRSARLWVAELGDARSMRMVDGLLPVQRHPPRWLEDGKTLLILAYPTAAPDTGAAVYSVDVPSGRHAKLELPAGTSPLAADPMPGKRMLMVTDEGGGKLSLKVMDTAAKPWRVLATRANVGEARYDPATDRIWFVQADSPGLWRADVGLRAADQFDPSFPSAYWMKLWLPIAGQPYTTRPTEDCALGWAAIGKTDRTACLERAIHYGIGEPTLSTDRAWLYYSASTVPESSDIALARLSETKQASR